MKNGTKYISQYLTITIGSAVYALGTVLFIFPHGLLLGGTSGISVILTSFLKQSPGVILTVINLLLLVVALVVLGKGMALKTLVGSLATTLFVALFEKLFAFSRPVVAHSFLSAVIGACVIALASAIMFYVDSSSGGTDIIALIIKKFSDMQIGRALLVSDVLIVIVGGLLSGWIIALGSFAGLLIKTLGIDFVIKIIQKKAKW